MALYEANHKVAVRAGELLYGGAMARLYRSTAEDEEQAFAYFRRYHDKKYSAVDCLSFVVILSHGITEAFSFDEDFSHRFVMRPGRSRNELSTAPGPVELSVKTVGETGRCTKTGKTLVRVDPRYFRPAEVDFLLGDPSKAKRLLGWEPKVTFQGLVEMMTTADLELAAGESGFSTKS